MSVDYSFLVVEHVERDRKRLVSQGAPLPEFWHVVTLLPFGDHHSLFAAAVVFDPARVWVPVPDRIIVETHGFSPNSDWKDGNSSDGQRFTWATPEQIVESFERRWASDAFFIEHAPDLPPALARAVAVDNKYARQLLATIKYLDLLPEKDGYRVLLDRR